MAAETTIGIQNITKQRLAKFGSKGETFEQILNRILNKVENDNEN